VFALIPFNFQSCLVGTDRPVLKTRGTLSSASEVDEITIHLSVVIYELSTSFAVACME